MSTTSLAAATGTLNGPRPGVVTQWDVWVFLVPLLAMSPMLLFQWQNLMSRPERQFFPLVILIALFFAIRSALQTHKRQIEAPVPLWRARVALAAFGSAVFLYALSVMWFSPWLAHVSA